MSQIETYLTSKFDSFIELVYSTQVGKTTASSDSNFELTKKNLLIYALVDSGAPFIMPLQ